MKKEVEKIQECQRNQANHYYPQQEIEYPPLPHVTEPPKPLSTFVRKIGSLDKCHLFFYCHPFPPKLYSVSLLKKMSKNGKKTVESSDSRAVKINFGTLGESEWEEELSTAAMRQF